MAKQEPKLGETILKNLVMGGTAGIIGACSTYPLDLIKTTLQNNKTPGLTFVGCFKNIYKSGGIFGFYRGLPAQLVGIAPEKALKLTVNDTLRALFTDKKTGEIGLVYEGLAGGMAGFSQVIVTNPYELVKVRLQTQGPGEKKSGFTILRELKLRGLFTGAGACLLRDVPFSVIYFTLYGRFKKAVKDEHGKVSPFALFMCGITAGAIASSGVTPADVIKTRLQVKSSTHQYKGIVDCFSRILKEEGPRALFKGIIPRMLIISPLFGITLATYEALQGFFL